MKTNDLIKCAIFSSLMCVSAYIAIPIPFSPVLVTAQTAVILISAVILGTKRSFVSALIYIALGAVGLPVFSGGKGGLGIIFSPTGGYVWGFLVAVLVVGIMSRNRTKSVPKNFFVMLLGAVIIDVCGSVQFALVSNTTFLKALLLTAIPFIPTDIIKALLSSILVKYLINYE